MKTALIIVDVQNDFCEGGSLAVEGGTKVASDISKFLDTWGEDYAVIVTTQDWHITPGEHFASTLGEDPNYNTTWPDHCVGGTEGAEIHPNLAEKVFGDKAVHFYKGQRTAAYSGFEGVLEAEGGMSLVEYLDQEGITAVDVCGIATDYCVRATVLDAAANGFDTVVITDLCAAVVPDNVENVLQEFIDNGAALVTQTVYAKCCVRKMTTTQNKTRNIPNLSIDQVERIQERVYSAVYFDRMVTTLVKSDLGEDVTMQVFQRQDAVLCGIDYALAVLSTCGTRWPLGFEVRALHDGDSISPWEPVMHINGNLQEFGHLESVYLGILARATRVATNTRKVVEAANGKDVLFFADRFDWFETQEIDGYAATVGGATAVATPAMTMRSNASAVGTMPHALIAVCGGDVVKACQVFREAYPDVPLVALVDFNNDVVMDSLRCLQEFGDDLYGVRLDTSGNMVDVSMEAAYKAWVRELNVDPYEFETAGEDYYKKTSGCAGVNLRLVDKVRKALDNAGGKHVKIVVSGGFNPERIRYFEMHQSTVDTYAVGSSLLKGDFDFTADIVRPVAKQGRELKDGSRLELVEFD